MKCLNKFTQMEMKLQEELWLKVFKHQEEQYCNLKIKYRSTNWNEVEAKDYESKDRPKAPEG